MQRALCGGRRWSHGGLEVETLSCQTEIIEQSVAQQMYSTCALSSWDVSVPGVRATRSSSAHHQIRHAFPELPWHCSFCHFYRVEDFLVLQYKHCRASVALRERRRQLDAWRIKPSPRTYLLSIQGLSCPVLSSPVQSSTDDNRASTARAKW